MNSENLDTYLDDHLAGSVVALELTEHIAATTDHAQRAMFLRGLHSEIGKDQAVLRDLIDRHRRAQSGVRKAVGWVVEKLGQAKLALEGNAGSGLGLLQGLEALVLGITGKRALWLALQAILPPNEATDFAGLIAKADSQLREVETLRLEAAAEAFRG